jgi:hypothetical protein
VIFGFPSRYPKRFNPLGIKNLPPIVLTIIVLDFLMPFGYS